MSDDDKEYPVGRGKPPVHRQFKKGQSGNPSGRPKGKKNYYTYMKEACERMITVTRDGKQRKMPAMQVMMEQTLNDAIKGDRHARKLIFDMHRYFEENGYETGNGRHGVLAVPGMNLSEEEWEKKYSNGGIDPDDADRLFKLEQEEKKKPKPAPVRSQSF